MAKAAGSTSSLSTEPSYTSLVDYREESMAAWSQVGSKKECAWHTPNDMKPSLRGTDHSFETYPAIIVDKASDRANIRILSYSDSDCFVLVCYECNRRLDGLRERWPVYPGFSPLKEALVDIVTISCDQSSVVRRSSNPRMARWQKATSCT